jgi:hypothetical protein
MARLEITEAVRPEPEPASAAGFFSVLLSNPVLMENAQWFVKLRWFIVAYFFLGWGASFFIREPMLRIGIIPPGLWPAYLGTALAFANLGFSLINRNYRQEKRIFPVYTIWLQIIIDLICLTLTVHFVGSIGTPAAFLYVIHIALSCIFFPLPISFLVTTLAAILYSTSVLLEYSGIWLPPSRTSGLAAHTWHSALPAATIIGIFFVVWYVVSRLRRGAGESGGNGLAGQGHGRPHSECAPIGPAEGGEKGRSSL